MSKWVSWEIEYFYSLRKKIAVLDSEIDTVPKPKYLESLPIAKFINNNLIILSNDKNKAFGDWVKSIDID
jgi:hypothetical protein